MAYRDKSQGFAFVYVDIRELLRKNQEQITKDKKSDPVTLSKDPNVLDFRREIVNMHQKPEANKEASPPNVHQKVHSVQQIKNNLDRLQKLHHKLHAILEDLNDKKKKK